jgi:hypothetical protein
MKKYILGLVVTLLSLTVFACDKKTTEAPTTDVITTEAPITQAPTTQAPIDNDFISSNSSNETKAQVIDKINMYFTKMNTIIGDYEMPIYANSENQSPIIKALAVDTPVIYNREDLTEPQEPIFDEEILNAEFIFMTYQMLQSISVVFEFCHDFTENEFCDFNVEGINYKVKILLEEDQLYIETYIYYAEEFLRSQIKQVSGQIMYFNLIDDVLYFETIQDNLVDFGGTLSHMLTYNSFSETGDMINIMIDDIYREHIYYQIYDRETKSVFLVSNSGEGFAINYTDNESDTFYSLVLDQNDSALNISIIYDTYNPTLKYISFDETKIIVWDIFDVEGWNKVYDYEYSNDMLYNDENQVLEQFYFDFEMQDDDIDHQLSIAIYDIEEITEGFISLSDYGMSYNQVSYEQLLADIAFINEEYPTIITNHGLSETMEENFEVLAEMFPVSLNQELMEELNAIIEQQLEDN